MKALVGAFNQEKALVGAFSVIVQPVVEPMDRFTALPRTFTHRLAELCSNNNRPAAPAEDTSEAAVQSEPSIATTDQSEASIETADRLCDSRPDCDGSDGTRGLQTQSGDKAEGSEDMDSERVAAAIGFIQSSFVSLVNGSDKE